MATPIRPQIVLDEDGANTLLSMLARDLDKPLHPGSKPIDIEKIREVVFGRRTKVTRTR